MAKFTCEKYPGLLVVGAGKFSGGVLEVDGEKAEKVRGLVGNPEFDVTEVDPPAPKRGRPRKSAESADSE